ncbi:MAG TPA: hypothetical protein VND65_00385 [Candidatus Binatia bacterium]|nr:hypothetical protein [Candidatus Binatia bacterium]
MPPTGVNSSQSTNPRISKPISHILDRKLAAYMAAAGAAGTALLAAPRAQAKVVYTPANVTLDGSYAIDLNHDGTDDFTVEYCGICFPHSTVLFLALDVPGNATIPYGKRVGEAAALRAGQAIGSHQPFNSFTSYGGVEMAVFFAYSHSSFGGPWAGAENKFLGLKFTINGEVHYGWARLSVGDFGHNGATVITGYAYETEANKQMFAGQVSSDEGASLGGLAAGAAK